jgi:hypothetical protein
MLKPGNLITYQPLHPASFGRHLVCFGTENTELKWISRNAIGVFVKISPDIANVAICLFEDQLFLVPISAIQLYQV